MFLYNLLDLKRTTWEGPELGAGKHTIVFDFKPEVPVWARAARASFMWMVRKWPGIHGAHHPDHLPGRRDLRHRTGHPHCVALLEYRYDVPFKFTGKIDKLTFALDPGPSAAKP